MIKVANGKYTMRSKRGLLRKFRCPMVPKAWMGCPGWYWRRVVGKPWSTFTIDSLTEGLSAEQQKDIRLKKGKTISKKEYDAYNEQQIKSRQ